MKRITCLVVLLALAGCKKEGAPQPGAKPRGPMAFPVEVAPVESREVEFAVRAVGSVEAFERVQVTARVAGVVDRVRFVEGQATQQGSVLVEIDPSRYTLAVRAAQATLKKATAARAEADLGLERREAVEKSSPGLIRGEEIESFRSRALSASAEQAAAQVALEQAQLNLRDAYVRAPVTGVLQTRTVETGQYVQPGTVLATLVRRDPLLLRFKVTEPEAARLSVGSTVRFSVRGQTEVLTAKLTHVAEAAEESSRMVTATAKIDDPMSSQLRPGAFAEVTVPVGKVSDAPVVPQTAVRPSEKGFLAFVVEDGVAHERVLELGLRTPEGLVEVREGVRPGEALVIRGAEALRDKAPVRVEKAALDAGVAAPARPGDRP